MLDEQRRSPSRRSGIWIIAIILVGVMSYIAGIRSTGARSSTQPVRADGDATTSITNRIAKTPKGFSRSVDFQEFWDVWSLLKDKYHKQPLDDTKLFYGALSGMAAAAGDPYTVFFPPDDAQSFSDSLQGKFDGIGAEIGMKDDILTIIAPLPDTPAEHAGILAGDAILNINGSSTEGMTVERAVSLIRGKKGTNVTLTLVRFKTIKDKDGKERQEPTKFDVTVTRNTIVVKSVRVSYPSPGIAQIEILRFNADTVDTFHRTVNDVLAKKTNAIILDLRNNPGGLLDQATALSGEWLGDQVVVRERRQGKIVSEFHGIGAARLKSLKTVVLVNEGSASASEIVAGALQDYGSATLIGTKTFGKGSVQEFNELQDGSAIKITVAEWLTPKGRSINEIGILPDVEIKKTEDDYHANRDPQLQKALEFLGAPTTTSAAK